MNAVTLAICGAGARGATYGRFARECPQRARVVAVAEPRRRRRQQCADEHGLDERAVFEDWRELLSRPRLADAVIIATQDDDHLEPALAAMKQGYHILLEKPMAPDEASCVAIAEAAAAAGVICAVCHVLRYTRFTGTIKKLLDQGAIGQLVSVSRLEPVGFWHHAHSYVRGNWRRADQSSSMLLAKSCHDLDWIRYVVGRPCRSVASFGRLQHFRRECAPPEAAPRCLDCSLARRCPYSAVEIYLEAFRQGLRGWPVDVLVDELTEDNLTEALRTGPYGRCVYDCDNDVVDHQVVAMEFEGGVTANFTMTAFTSFRERNTRLFGTHGEICGDGERVELFDFQTRRWQTIATEPLPQTTLTAHGGGDYWLMDAFTAAVAAGSPSLVASGPAESLETHRMVFAAERARLNASVEHLP